jgi:hypothetical protein
MLKYNNSNGEKRGIRGEEIQKLLLNLLRYQKTNKKPSHQKDVRA